MKRVTLRTNTMNRTTDSGFSRADLIAIVSALSLLALCVNGGLSATQRLDGDAACLENLRKLTLAWSQFGIDLGYFPPNPDDGNRTLGYNWVPGLAFASHRDAFNPDLLADSKASLLVSYLSDRDVGVFRCPEDHRQGEYQGRDPLKVGTVVPVVRSYSMNGAVGTDPYVKSPVGTRIGGPWLDNSHTHNRSGRWRTYGKFDDIVNPSPASLAVLIDEDELSINDGTFGFGMERAQWIDWPGTRHAIGATVSFSDGHAVLKRWTDPRTVVQDGNLSIREVPGSADYEWLHDRISALKRLSRPLAVVRPENFGPPSIQLVWPTDSGTNYRAEYSDDLLSWHPVASEVLVTENEVGVVDRSIGTIPGRFYRLITEP